MLCQLGLRRFPMAKKIVGILGGMGPEATVDFMSKIIKPKPAAL